MGFKACQISAQLFKVGIQGAGIQGAGIQRAHELRSLAFFDALEALTSPFKASKNTTITGAALPA